MNEEAIITKETVAAYIKKYWWIIAISFFIGVLCFLLLVRRNDGEIQENISYEQDIIPVILEDEKPVSITLIRGNCQRFLGLEEIQEEINSFIISQEGIGIADWSTIKVENVDDSLVFTLSIMQDDKTVAEKQADAIVNILNNKLLQYKQNVELQQINRLQEKRVRVSDGQSIYLQDVLMVFAFLAAGMLIVYMFALFGNKVSNVVSVEKLLHNKASLNVNKKEFSLVSEWLNSLDQQKTTLFVMGTGSETVLHEISSHGNKKFIPVSFGQYGNELRKNPDSKKYLVVYCMKDRIPDIQRILKISQMYNVKLDGYIYIKA